MKIENNNIGYKSVVYALTGNFLITISKFIGFTFTGSAALFAEGVHSFADTANQFLLFVGIKRSKRVASERYRFGFGQERFFWALISACGIFFVGAGVTIYHGISALILKEVSHFSIYIVYLLIIAIIIESFTLKTALSELNFTNAKSKNKKKGIIKIIQDGDPTTVAVVLEDSVAVLGTSVALASILITHITQNYIYDAITSIFIGILLTFVSFVLIYKNYEYLIGKSLSSDIIDKIKDKLNSDPAVEKVIDIMSSAVDVDKYHIVCEVEINGAALIRRSIENGELRSDFEDIENKYNDFVKFSLDMADRVPRLIGAHIDKLGKEIHDEFEEVAQVDIEIR